MLRNNHLSIDEGTARNPDPGARVHDSEEVRVVGEGVEGGHHDHAKAVQVRVLLGNSASWLEVLHHPT